MQESGRGANTPGKTSNYLNLHPEIPRYCCRDESFYFGVYFYKNMTDIYNRLPRTPSRGNAVKCLFQEHNRMA